MNGNKVHSTMFAGATLALVALTSGITFAATPATPTDAREAAPVVVAVASPAPGARADALALDEYPAYQRGVREAAAQGNEALRRYVWRTRMIYNFYFNDFAQQE